MPELVWAKPKKEEDKGKDFVNGKDKYEAYLHLGDAQAVKVSFRKAAIKIKINKILGYEVTIKEIDDIMEYLVTHVIVPGMQEAFKAGVQFGMAYVIEKEKGTL